MISDELILFCLVAGLGGMAATHFWMSLSSFDAFLFVITVFGLLAVGILYLWEFKSKSGREIRKKIQTVKEIPLPLITPSTQGVRLGAELDLGIDIYLPDQLRRRHVHILGSTGSGKTESVILNLLKQDVDRGLGSIILDAKGDASFMKSLQEWIPNEKLKIFDLSSEESRGYDPLAEGSAIESAQRLFSSLNWSEEYYKSKAFTALQKLFQNYRAQFDRNPTLFDLNCYLETPQSYSSFVAFDGYSTKLAESDFKDLSGLRDQIQVLSIGHLQRTLSPINNSDGITLHDAQKGSVIYFRLQSLISPQLVGILGRMITNHINFLAGSAHRIDQASNEANLVPIYLDEFASFACPEFADLISKARSAGFALHFSHQSIGDLTEVSDGFLNRITDNSGTKIVMRINDPDSAEYFARSFGTKKYQKVTQRITNVKEVDLAEVVGEGSQREAHQFRAAPDLFKTLPTGVGAVLIAHGSDTPVGGSHVFKIRFPKPEAGKEKTPMIVDSCSVSDEVNITSTTIVGEGA